MRESLAVAEKAGIAPAQVIIDPGFGFAKTPAHNLELVRRLGELLGMGHAVLIGPSRKSTTGLLIGETDQAHRLEPSLALAVLSVQAGAHMVRVHDVAETVRALARRRRRGSRDARCASRPADPGPDRVSADPAGDRHGVGGTGEQPRPPRPEPRTAARRAQRQAA